MESNNTINTLSIEYTSNDFIPSYKSGYFLESIERIKKIDYLPIRGAEKVRFSDDEWNLKSLLGDDIPNKSLGNFIFTSFPDNFKELMKMFTYWTLSENRKKKLTTFRNELYIYNKIFTYLNENYLEIKSINPIIISDILKIEEDKGLAYSTLVILVCCLKQFLNFYSTHISYFDIDSSIKKIDNITKKLRILIKNDEERKYKDIPNDYFNKFLSCCIKIMDSKDFHIDMRCYAATFVLLSQTGFRNSQICKLKVNKIIIKTIEDMDDKAIFLKYPPLKERDVTLNESDWPETILNEIAYKAYIFLEKLYKKRRLELKIDYLICPTRCKSFPLIPNTLGENLIKFVVKMGPKIGAVNCAVKYPNLKYVTFGSFKKQSSISENTIKTKYNNYKDNDTISYPTCHQFRVHLCTDLYYQGVPLNFIQRYMNHLTEEMTDYYIRREKYSKKEDTFANAVLTTIVKDGVKPLGSGSNKLIHKIDEFIKNGKFNINTDIDTIISELKSSMPIKEKLGGICIKSGLKRPCNTDASTDEFYCAYGVCPNHFHLFYMADVSYDKCKKLFKSMKYNQDNDFRKQASHERNKLINVAKNSLLPELEQLKEEIDKKGSRYIKENYPQITQIIDNLDGTFKEVEEWIQLKK